MKEVFKWMKSKKKGGEDFYLKKKSNKPLRLFVMYVMSMLGSPRMIYLSVHVYVFMTMRVDSRYVYQSMLNVCVSVWVGKDSVIVSVGIQDVLLNV